MKKLIGLLSVAIIGGSLMASVPAKADTAYHAVYEAPVTPNDPFSIMDKYQNNALTAAEYNNAQDVVPFSTVDTNGNGFITRAEYYTYYDNAGNVRQNVMSQNVTSQNETVVSENETTMNSATPAAGGDTVNNEVQAQYCRCH